MIAIGKKLKQAREAQGYTLEEMEEITKIHTRYLHVMEEDRFDLLPSPFYARTFLKSYAKRLGLNDHAMVLLYQSRVEAAKKAEQINTVPSLEKRSATRRMPVVQIEESPIEEVDVEEIQPTASQSTSTMIYTPPLTAAIYAKEMTPPSHTEHVPSLLQPELSEISKSLPKVQVDNEEGQVMPEEGNAPEQKLVSAIVEIPTLPEQVMKLPKKKKNSGSKTLWISFLVILLLAIGGGVIYYLYFLQ